MDDPDQALNAIMRYGTEVAHCAGAAVGVPAGETGYLRVAAARAFADSIDSVSAVEGTIYRQAMIERQPIVVNDLGTDPRTAERAMPGVGAMVAVPMLTDLSADGVLFLCRAIGEPQFDAVDLEMLAITALRNAVFALQQSGASQ